ncbi:SLC13 family permease [Streptomyces purpurogeneiscleroticus]|uniref:SLC13 family permease n=1 Tax=Streptomyces purpurogeneiscleroticus TaxID=68259 RepID=UPI001CBD0789|nr:SLC13 family permease [Streptomyces purpurogeneiscleroticus]MBZ4020376.1 C4-dicarboxylate ABC transporter [Streptomyces purpurogeneiscleroticus]
MVQVLSLIALVGLFLVATLTPVNMGLLAFVAAFAIGAASGISLDDVFAAFPGDTFVLIVGITLLFGIARANGTIDLVVAGALRLVRGRRWAVVWLMFALAGVLMALGSVLAVGMLAPIAMPIAHRYRINPLLMGMMLSHGALGAAFSPITVYGAFTSDMAARAGLHINALLLFAVVFALNFLFALVLFLVLGRGLLRREADAATGTDRVTFPDVIGGTGSQPSGDRTAGTSTGRGTATAVPRTTAPEVPAADRAAEVTPIRLLTLIGLVGLVVGAGVFRIDVGVTALVIAAVLLLVAPQRHKEGMTDISWSAVLLVSGMMTYMAVLTQNRTLAELGDAAGALGSPLLAALLLCLVVGIVSAFGSSLGTLGIALPIAFPLIEQGGISAVALVLALAFCSTVVDVSPYSTNGVIVLAQAQVPDKQRFQRKMLGYTGLVVAGAPLLVWLTVLMPTSV